MELRLYNTQTRKKELFRPIKSNGVGFYSCGPTIYWYQHIGNMRTYIFNDILKRVLLYNKFKVKHVMNYTDVGHLTSDEDTGEDKIEKAAKKEGKTAREITDYYSKVFEQDCKKLNIIKPSIIARATDNIKEQINLINVLTKKHYTYKTSDGIYFDTSKLKDYGKLAKLNIKELQEGKRIGIKEKRNKTDFALWKFSEEPGVRQQEWDFEGKKGYPGWHIECSAMSSKYLGKQFDIHTGGREHIPVHHTNEIAQSEAAFGKKPWVKYWLHAEWLTFKGKKISKSTGGLYTISELERQGFDPLDFRYLTLTTIYRKRLNFDMESLKSARISFEKLKNIILELKNKKNSKGDVKQYNKKFLEAVNDDLNVPKGLSILWQVLRDNKIGSRKKYSLALKFDKVLGLNLKNVRKEIIPRRLKEWKKSDEIREAIRKKGYQVEDTSEGYKIKKSL
ncbi:cysteine--tRNA ligase [Candidatus Woesearchaeota archaeon]|nr:cysteine--tRNA ligase [Candidatus Woesearchaeota archaeon]